jgi:hypothetical protein
MRKHMADEDYKKKTVTAVRASEIDEMEADGFVIVRNYPNYMVHPDGLVWSLARYLPPGSKGRCQKEGRYLAVDNRKSKMVTIYNEDGPLAIRLSKLLEINFGKQTFEVSREFMEMVEEAANALLVDDMGAVSFETLNKIKETCSEVLHEGVV